MRQAIGTSGGVDAGAPRLARVVTPHHQGVM